MLRSRVSARPATVDSRGVRRPRRLAATGGATGFDELHLILRHPGPEGQGLLRKPTFDPESAQRSSELTGMSRIPGHKLILRIGGGTGHPMNQALSAGPSKQGLLHRVLPRPCPTENETVAPPRHLRTDALPDARSAPHDSSERPWPVTTGRRPQTLEHTIRTTRAMTPGRTNAAPVPLHRRSGHDDRQHSHWATTLPETDPPAGATLARHLPRHDHRVFDPPDESSDDDATNR